MTHQGQAVARTLCITVVRSLKNAGTLLLLMRFSYLFIYGQMHPELNSVLVGYLIDSAWIIQ